jgi:hypothetical protein
MYVCVCVCVCIAPPLSRPCLFAPPRFRWGTTGSLHVSPRTIRYKRDLVQCQKRPSSVKRDLVQCQKRPSTVSTSTALSADMPPGLYNRVRDRLYHRARDMPPGVQTKHNKTKPDVNNSAARWWAPTYSVKRDLVQCQKRPSTVSKETYKVSKET